MPRDSRTLPSLALILFSLLAILASAGTVQAEDYPLSVTASADSPSPNPVHSGKESLASLSASIDASTVNEEAVANGPAWSWSITKIQYRSSSSSGWTDSATQVANITASDPASPSATLHFNGSWGYWKVTCTPRVTYEDNDGNTWDSDTPPKNVTPVHVTFTCFTATVRVGIRSMGVWKDVPNVEIPAQPDGSWDWEVIGASYTLPGKPSYYTYLKVFCTPSDLPSRPDVKLVVDRLSGATYSDPPSYTPPSNGGVSHSGDGEWVYYSFKEPKTEKNPGAPISAWVKPQYLGQDIGSPVRIQVNSIFYHLTHTTIDMYGATINPSEYHYLSAAEYASWKYDVSYGVGGNWYVDLTISSYGKTNPTPFLSWERDTYLYQLAFNDENVCASTIGHENVHRGQSLYVLLQSVLYTDAKKFAEGEAYYWEFDHFAQTGLSAAEQTVVTDALRYINDTTGTVPDPGI